MSGIIIDSLGRNINPLENTLHTRNSKILARELNFDLIGSVNPPNKKYDKVIFVHSSPASKVNDFKDFFELNKNSDIYYIKNEWNLGESVIYWALFRDYKTKCSVIANHEKAQPYGSRFDKYFDDTHKWNVVNLNALIYNEFDVKECNDLFDTEKKPILYYGSERKDREKYFAKYFDDRMVVSTADVNIRYFKKIANVSVIDKLNWHGSSNTLLDFKSILYLEDMYTHTHYDFLANRFYESLTLNIPCFFDTSCSPSIKKSGYNINEWYVVGSKEELWDKLNSRWEDYNFNILKNTAQKEKAQVISDIKKIVGIDNV